MMWWQSIWQSISEYWLAILGVVLCLSLAVPMVRELQFKYRQIVFTRMLQIILVLMITAVLFLVFLVVTNYL